MTKRILCIDGGGSRGVFAAAIIEQMEITQGRKAADIFDCFVGTSAGSVLAAGLASGHSAREMKEAFIEAGAPRPGAAANPGPRQRSDELKAVYQKFFGDTRASDVPSWFAVVTRNMRTGKTDFLGNFPKDRVDSPSFWADQGSNDDIPVWEMVLRSTALPPIYEPQGDFVDGGISPFANPTYAAFTGVQRRLAWDPYREGLKFYSVGTGYRVAHDDISRMEHSDLLHAMLSAMMSDVTFLQHEVMARHRDQNLLWYKRYTAEFTIESLSALGVDPVPSEQELAVLAQTISPMSEELARIGSQVGAHLVRAADFAEYEGPQNRRVSVIPIPPGRERRRMPQPVKLAGDSA